MANPQLEDGYTRIAHEIVEALARCAPGHGEMQVLWTVLRKTYGWNKKEDELSIGQIADATGLSRRMAIYCLQNLEAKRMITITRKRGRGIKNEINSIGFQKNTDLWLVQEKSTQYKKALDRRKLNYQKSKSGVVQEIEGSARNAAKVVQETGKNGRFLAPTKERKKTKDSAVADEPPPNPLSAIVEKTIRRLNELSGKSYRPESKAVNQYLVARLKDGATEADVIAVVEDRWQRWKDKPAMVEHFNPITLFRPSNFERYLTEARAANSPEAEPIVKDLPDGMVEVDGRRIHRDDYRRRYGQEPKPNA